jgi:5-methylthioadenosine/S-adenosylhomocysteine deaminase
VTALAATGTRVSISPHSELLIGYGFPRTAELLAAGIGVGLSVDSTVLTGELTTIDLPQVRSEAQRALAGLRARVGG